MEELQIYRKPLTAEAIVAQVQVIQSVMKAVMIEGTHYGTIPGTPKPTLYKPGSEKILATFRIAAYPKEVEDLSTDDEIRYRVKVHGLTLDGDIVGVGIGEASSNEEKYKWRKPVCEEEYNETPPDRKREVWKRGSPNYKLKQVRMNPSDVANTILKMAKKRAQIDMTLTATAASDIFDQDLEDMTDEVRETVSNGRKEPPKQPQAKSEQTDGKASQPQQNAIHAILGKLNVAKELHHGYVSEKLGINPPIKSMGELTKDQASQAIKLLGEILTVAGQGQAE